jgi:hypothetical protein
MLANASQCQQMPARAVPTRIRGREIVASDLEAVAELLAKGLGYSRGYFSRILDRLTQHHTPAGYPKYGYVLLSDDVIVGAILLIFSTIQSSDEVSIRCHVTSWYVDSAYRPYATFFIAKALKRKEVTYLNVSARPHTVAIIKHQGFSEYSHGQFASIPIISRGSYEDHVQLIKPDALSSSDVDAFEQELMLTHANFGCLSLWCVIKERAYPFVFQARRFKGLVPGVQLIYCRDLKDFVRFAQPIGRFLALSGRFVVRIDSNGPIPGLVGKYFPGMEPRYFKGLKPPRIGDLAYTQTIMDAYPRKKWLGLQLPFSSMNS